jgi:4-amino-4-deoxy-L-arabinose transferase-like glycosyltransferase
VQAESRPSSSTSSRALLAALLAVLGIALCRLWLAETLPLTDTTEARYGEMARKMVETGDWLVPQHDYGVPYLAKPPLAFWASAVGIEAFGAGELGPRLPILVLSLAFCAFLFYWARIELGSGAAAGALVLTASSLLFFVSMAAVMTDMVLTACGTTALLAFWRRYRGGSGWWEVALYVALGLGLLAKGPLAVVLWGVPVVAWAWRFGHVREVWQRFAWLRGVALAALVAVPWYIAAEIRNPGFLDYFIVGEHIKRFLIPGWSGDLYGRAHDVPRGTIWLYFVIGTLPWSLAALPALVIGRQTLRRNWQVHRELVWFLLAGALASLGLFTLSGNVILPYALPAIPLTVLAVVALDREGYERGARLVVLGAVGLLMAFTLTVLAAVSGSFVAAHTQRQTIAAIHERTAGAKVPIYYWQARYFSADYYSRGATATLDDRGELARRIAEGRPFYLVVAGNRVDDVPADLRPELKRVGEVAGFVLFEPAYVAPRAAEAGR